MAFSININEHDTLAYVKIQSAAHNLAEAALLAYYCDGHRKQLFHNDMESEINRLLEILGLDETAQKDALIEATENYQYQIENLRAALRVIEALPPREIEEAWSIATLALRDDDEFAAMPARPIRR